MKKHIVFRTIGIALTALAVCFIWYALNHPTASFPWSNFVTYLIFALYILATITMFVLAAVIKKKRK